MRRDKLRAVLRIAAFGLVTLLLLPVFFAASLFGDGARNAIRRLWAHGTCRALGIRVRRQGHAFEACPTLFVPNHVSYLDIPILCVACDGVFIAKSDVAGWPLFGFLGRITKTHFIRRHWRDAKIQRDAIAARMRGGESFILFPEGTSSNGLGVLPFKTSLLSVMEPWIMDCPVAAQPVSIHYRRLADGRPYDAATCDLYAWYGDMEFAPHLWAVAQGPGLEVEVRLHEPVLSWSVKSRKVLGPALRDLIREDLFGPEPATETEPPFTAPIRRAA